MKDVRLVIGNKNYSSWSLCPWLLLKMFDVDFEEHAKAIYDDPAWPKEPLFYASFPSKTDSSAAPEVSGDSEPSPTVSSLTCP